MNNLKWRWWFRCSNGVACRCGSRFTAYRSRYTIRWVTTLDLQRILLSEDEPLPPGLCAGQQFVEEGDLMNELPCSGHGSCVGTTGDDSPLEAIASGNQGWLGPTAQLRGFTWPWSPSPVPTRRTVNASVRMARSSTSHSCTQTIRDVLEPKAYWDYVELVLYVDGRPYPQPYPNNVFPTPTVNQTTDGVRHPQPG